MSNEHSLPENVILANKKTMIEMLRSTKREGIDNLISFMNGPESDFFTAPASSRYHLCTRGGLNQHSLNVQYVGDILNKTFGLFTTESLNITTNLHDIEKGTKKYVEKYLKNGSRGATPYEKTEDLPLGHGEKSVMLIQKYIDLTPQEAMCIRWHMGPYDYAFRQYEEAIKRTYPEVFMIYFADHLATLFLDNGKLPAKDTKEMITAIAETVEI